MPCTRDGGRIGHEHGRSSCGDEDDQFGKANRQVQHCGYDRRQGEPSCVAAKLWSGLGSNQQSKMVTGRTT